MAAQKKYKYILAIIILVLFLLLGLVGCNNKTEITDEDILTQKVIESGRTPITILVKYAFSINGFEKAVEEKFPDIDIIQVGNYTRDMGINEYESRLEHNDLTDIVMTWPLDVGEKYWDDRLLDLSGMEFTSKYNISVLNNISKNGKLYYLPGPAQIRGILYNKTLFEEKGWKIPEDFEGFIELCKTIEKSGIRSIQLGFKNSEVLDTAFIGYNYENYFSKPQDIKWIEDYNKGTGNFEDHFSGALDVFQRMIDEGIWKENDLNIGYAEREKMLFNRQCAMVEDSVLMARMGYSQTGSTDEYALMPFFNPGAESDWARLYMVCYIGLNKQLVEEKNKEKYELVMKLMDYISTPEGQKALASDTDAMFSSLKGVSTPNIPEIQDLTHALESGRYGIFYPFKNAQAALREGLAGMIKGTVTKHEVIKMVDNKNTSSQVLLSSKKLGTADADFSIIETGNFVTDAMREYSGCDIALFMDNGKDGRYNGKGISGRLYNGDVTTIDIERILPDLKHGEEGVLWKITMSGEDLIKTLEYSMSVDNNNTGWFYYFSGLRMEYNPKVKPGGRINKITTNSNEAIDNEKMYSIAVMDYTVPDELISSCEKTDVKISDILEDYITAKQKIFPSKDGRFTVAK